MKKSKKGKLRLSVLSGIGGNILLLLAYGFPAWKMGGWDDYRLKFYIWGTLRIPGDNSASMTLSFDPFLRAFLLFGLALFGVCSGILNLYFHFQENPNKPPKKVKRKTHFIKMGAKVYPLCHVGIYSVLHFDYRSDLWRAGNYLFYGGALLLLVSQIIYFALHRPSDKFLRILRLYANYGIILAYPLRAMGTYGYIASTRGIEFIWGHVVARYRENDWHLDLSHPYLKIFLVLAIIGAGFWLVDILITCTRLAEPKSGQIINLGVSMYFLGYILIFTGVGLYLGTNWKLGAMVFWVGGGLHFYYMIERKR
jgi:hypothetical protein